VTTPEEIDPAEIKSVLAKAIACLSAGLIDMRTAAKITTAAKRANTLVRDGFVATDDARRGFALLVADLRDADRKLAALLATKDAQG